MDTRLVIEIPEELNRRIEACAAAQGLSVKEVVRQYLEEYATGLGQFNASSNSLASIAAELGRPLTPEEVASTQEGLARLRKLGEQISQKWPEGVSAADAIKEDRRDL